MTKLASSPSAVSSSEISNERLQEIVCGLIDNPSKTPEEMLKNPDILTLAIAVARKQRSFGRLEREKATIENVVATRLQLLLDEGFDEYKEVNKQLMRRRGVQNLQMAETNVLSPIFVFEDVNLATSWRWLLVDMIRFINCLSEEAVKRGEPRRNLLSDLYDRLQLHINAADMVLLHYFRVEVKHRGDDLRSKVKDKIFLEGEKFAEYVNLLVRYKKLCERFEGLMGNDCQMVQ